MADLKKCFFWKHDVLIFNGEAERSGSYGVEAPGSNPIQGYEFFPLFSLQAQVLGHSVLNEW